MNHAYNLVKGHDVNSAINIYDVNLIKRHDVSSATNLYATMYAPNAPALLVAGY